MKKILLKIILITVLFIGIFGLKSYAGTFKAEEQAQNTVKIALSVDNGIVRAISMSLKITGDVSVETLQWSNEMSAYMKRYTYNKNTKILDIYVTPGTGISMNQGDEINIGNVKFTGDKDGNYKIKLEKIQLIGGNHQNLNEQIEKTEKTFWYSKNGGSTEEGKITSKDYEIKGQYISKIGPNTKVSDFKKKIDVQGNWRIQEKDGSTASDDAKTKTGMKIIVGSKEYTLVVTGDVDGNGEITLNDVAQSCLHVIDKEILEGAYKEAANVDYTGEVTLNDLAVLQLTLIGKN